MIGGLAAVLAARLAAGILLAAGLIGARHRVPEGFRRFVLTAAAAGLGLALLFGTSRPEFWCWVGLFAAAAGLRLVGTRRLGLTPRRGDAVMAALGAVGAVLPGFFASGDGITVLAGAAGAALLGATAASMVLGHWYLVDTALSIRPLAFASTLLIAAAVLRVGSSAFLLLTGGVAALRLSSPADLIYSTTALFFCFRAITGLVAPLVLSWLVRSTVRIRSTQSATGLLYVALILVLFGELTAVFLEGASGGRLS